MLKIERELLAFLKEYNVWQKESFPLQQQAGWLLKVDEEYKEFQAELKKRIRDMDKVREEAADYLFVLQGLRQYSPELANHLQSTFFLLYSKLVLNEDFLKMVRDKFRLNKARTFKFHPIKIVDGIYKGDHNVQI